MSFRIIVFLALTIGLTSGCSKTSTVDKMEEAPTSTPSPMSKVNIDDVLARTDYSDAVRKKFEQLKKNGRKEVLEREISETIRLSLIKEPVTMEVTSRLHRGEFRQPTLSVLKDPPPSKYPRKPTNALQLLEGEADYARLGVEHFMKREIFQLKDEDRQAVADYMNSVLDGPDPEFNRKVWEELSVVGAELAKRIEPQLKEEPMFNLCLAINESNIDMIPSANMRMDYAIELFAATEYPTRLPVYAIRLLNNFRQERRSKTTYYDRIAAVKHWLTKDFRARDIEERFALKDVQVFLDLAFLNRDLPAVNEFVYYIETSDTLPKWFQSMALAEYYYKLGYYYRGTGFSDSVTDEGWKKLEENSKLAHEYYEESLKINPNYPEAAIGLMNISRLGYSNKTEEYWFKKAIEHEVDYMNAYRTRLFGLMPRWGGSVDEMIKFATEQANKKQYETGVPFILPQCLVMLRSNRILDNREEYEKLIDDPKLLGNVITALEGLVEHNTQRIFRSRVQDEKFLPTLLALYLTRAGRVDEAERVYRTLDRQHNPLAVKLYGAGGAGSLDALSASAAAMNAEYGMEAKQIEKLMVDSVEKRIANLDAIEEIVGNISLSDESGGLFFSRALKQVQEEKAFADGDIVKVDFDPQMNMWKMGDNRQLTYVSESAATFDNRSGDRYNSMVYRATFPGPKVTEVTFTMPENKIPNPEFAPGFVAAKYNSQNYTFGISFGGCDAANAQRRAAKPAEVCDGKVVFGAGGAFGVRFPYRNNQVKLRVYTDKNWIEVYADDQYVFSYRNSAFEDLSPPFALQMNRGVGGTGEVEFSDITIRKWSGAPPQTRRPAKLVEHYQQIFDADPDDRWNQFWLAHALHNHDDLDAALKLYKQSVESGVNKQMAGFYIGDILDRQGKRKEAFDWYVESATGRSDGGEANLMYAHSPDVAKNGPLNWSCFRASWLSQTCGFELDDRSKMNISRRAKIPREISWLNNCRRNFPKKDAPKNTLDHRLESLDRNIQKTPQRYKKFATEVREAIEANGVYEVSPDDEPLYLKVKEATPFFRSLDKMR